MTISKLLHESATHAEGFDSNCPVCTTLKAPFTIPTYKTQRAAMAAAAHYAHAPALVLLANGRYDTYPTGQRIPVGARIIARLAKRGWVHFE